MIEFIIEKIRQEARNISGVGVPYSTIKGAPEVDKIATVLLRVMTLPFKLLGTDSLMMAN